LTIYLHSIYTHTAITKIYSLSLHDALPISAGSVIGAWIWYGLGALLGRERTRWVFAKVPLLETADFDKAEAYFSRWGGVAVLLGDRKSTRLNSSHVSISYAVFCLKKNNKR